MLALAWPADNATIAWGKSVVEANPTLPVILTTHDLLAIKSDAVSPLETESGLRLWDGLIKDHDQIFLTINGHSHGSAHLRKTNTFGHSVDQIVWDYQMAYQGGNGYLGLIEFDFTNKRMATTVVSPWVRLKPKNTLVGEYDIAVKPGPNENLNLPIDWDQRFAGFQTAPAPVAASNGDLVAAAKAKVLEGFEEPEVVLPKLPLNDTDFPEVAGTVAHWRFDPAKAGALPVGDVGAKDIAAGADMRRAALAATSQLDDLKISTDHHALSSDSASRLLPEQQRGPQLASSTRPPAPRSTRTRSRTASPSRRSSRSTPAGRPPPTSGTARSAARASGVRSRTSSTRGTTTTSRRSRSASPTCVRSSGTRWASRRRATATASARTGRARS